MLVKCSYCGIDFYKKKNEVLRHQIHYCSIPCRAEGRKKKRIKIRCLHCNKQTTNPKFCSLLCSIVFNNKQRSEHRKNSSLVKQRNREDIKEAFKSKTLKEVLIHNTRPGYRFNVVRAFNKNWNRHLSKLPCANCGYSKHVQLAHIKAISSFPDTATLGEINSPENIIQLCPNCHWEFDNGLLSSMIQ